MITTLGSWEADHVGVDDVERALSMIRRHQKQAAVRASVLTLVCVIPALSRPDQALETLSQLGARHPARTLVIITEEGDDSAPAIHAWAAVQVVEVDGRSVCYEEVVLRVHGPARHHLDSIIRPLSLPDLTVVIWTPTYVPALGDPLLGAADRMLVDSQAAARPEQALRQVAKVVRQLPVTDLSWVRLAPWRSQLAGLFHRGGNRPFLGGVDHLEVNGSFAARHLLAGWVIRRLLLRPEAVTLGEAGDVSIRVTASCDAKHGEFAVSGTSGEQAIVTKVDIEDRPSWTQTLLMDDRRAARALAEAFTRTDGDDSYRDALAGALGLL